MKWIYSCHLFLDLLGKIFIIDLTWFTRKKKKRIINTSLYLTDVQLNFFLKSNAFKILSINNTQFKFYVLLSLWLFINIYIFNYRTTPTLNIFPLCNWHVPPPSSFVMVIIKNPNHIVLYVLLNIIIIKEYLYQGPCKVKVCDEISFHWTT